MDDDAEIIAEFLVESHENLDQLDHDLVALEADPNSRELLSSIFRTIHTIKGTSGFLAFGRLEELTHVGEHLLSLLRDGEMEMNSSIAEALLAMVDTVRELLECVESTGSDSGEHVDVHSVVAALRAVLEEGPGPAEDAATPGDALDDGAATTPTPATQDETADASVDADSSPEATSDAEPEEGVAVAENSAPTPEPVAEDESEQSPQPEAPIDLDALEAIARAELDEPAPADAPSEAGPDDVVRRGVVDSSVRVDVDLLDSLVQLVGELVLTRNQVLQRTQAADDAELIRAAQRLDLVASELQEGIMKTRMQPIGQVWSKMPRVVRDLAVQLGREVKLDMEGHETELDRSLLEALKGPLTHLVRNSLDHGIEKPEDRVARGKSPQGRLFLRAFHESGQVVIEITDDGKGIDPDEIARVAIQRGVITRDEAARMDDRDLLNLIFRPGFSTAAEVTNVSGRGVGMDVVRTNIERIGGTVDMQSQVGVGTTCRVRIPLTLAIIPALVVGDDADRYAIPQANLVELVRIEAGDVENKVEIIAGAPLLRLRGHLLPLVSLDEVLGREPGPVEAMTVVVVQADEARFGLCVSEVHDTQEIVVKPIGRQLKGMTTYAGATIMGDGRVSLILDIPGIAHAQGVAGRQAPTEQRDGDGSSVASESTALLVLEVAGGQRAALPLREVSRLEEFAIERIERSGMAEAVQYREGILPLVRLAPAIGLSDAATEGKEQISVVVHEAGDQLIGIVIDRVLDVVDTEILPSDVGRRAGVLGSAVIQDRVTDLVDLDAVVARSGVGA